MELALRGEPRDPLYMVGCMGDQPVVIRAEKGKVKMLVDDSQELIYDATRGPLMKTRTRRVFGPKEKVTGVLSRQAGKTGYHRRTEPGKTA